MSLLYTGTPALKTDFTRTMKRTIFGELADGKNSIKRYFINNFCDGYNHDCLDLWQRKITPISNLNRKSFLHSLKLVLIGVIGILVVTNYFLHKHFPYPDKEAQISDSTLQITAQEIDWHHSKTMILHKLTYFGLILVCFIHVLSKYLQLAFLNYF